jgi:Fe-coproporphyrin III synthase
MLHQSLYNTFRRYFTLKTGTIRALPIVMLMPHSACNCCCVMCDLRKDDKNLRQFTENAISGLLNSLKKLNTQQVVMSGGEELLNPNFFRFCEILQKQNIKISLLFTGVTLKKHAVQLVTWVNDAIVSLDGNEEIHNRIRNIPDAYQKLKEGVHYIKSLTPYFKITARTVIHRLNFRHWADIIDSAKEIGVNQISFLTADTSSHAFNREVLLSDQLQHEILLHNNEVAELNSVTDNIIKEYIADINSCFIAENPEKLRKIYNYYAAFYGLNPFPYEKCNDPWVSAVVEADGTVRPCFFHEPVGNTREESLENILNNEKSRGFRKNMDINTVPV